MTFVQNHRASHNREAAALEVRLLGVVDYDSALSLQQRLVEHVCSCRDAWGGLLICEHPPVITIGNDGSFADIGIDSEELRALQLKVRWIRRSGECIVHGPGQLAVYPIVPLDRLEIPQANYAGLLEDCVAEVCRSLQVAAVRHPQETGLWCRTGKLCHVGVAMDTQVAYHGVFLNVAPDLVWMRHILSAAGNPQGSLASARMRPTAMNAVKTALIQSLTARLGYQRHHIYTGHPLLRRTRRKIYVSA